ncbi:MAG: sigma-70 family RNA polymerase sigma factor [Saprospiraceae bacterium]|nr:sigma-70 family RNA polymerase sigma factor [Pyrinomonadaceae bacterium]
MANLKFSLKEKGEGRGMFFSKSITFDDEDLSNAAAAALSSSAYSSVELEFIEKLRSGDADAFDVLVTRYSSDIYALLYRLTENPEEAGDLTQETFMSALKSVKSFRGESELKTWLFRIAVNHSRNRHRWWNRRKRDKTVSLDAPIGDSDRLLSETMAGTSDSPEDAAMMRQRETALRNALLDLPDIFREAIILCDIEGQTYEDISRMLDVNIGTVKSRIARGREELRRRLKDF